MRTTLLCAVTAVAALACAAPSRAGQPEPPAPDPTAAGSPCGAPAPPPLAGASKLDTLRLPLGEDLRLIHVCPSPPDGERPPVL